MLEHTKNSLLLRKRRGVTMVMMLILVPIIMLIAVSYIEPIIRSYRAGVNDQKTLLAKSVANSMFEVALWESRGGGTGDVTHNAEWPAPAVHEFDFGDAEVTWSVFGTPEVDNEHLIDIDDDGTGDWYTIPSPGSGDAGGTYCSTNEPVVNVTMLENVLDVLGFTGDPIADPFNWPCHWNKIREGENVSIPLYTDDGTTVLNPVDLGLTEFDLRIRAACDPEALADDPEEFDHEICGDGERYYVKGDSNQFFTDLQDTVIVLWEIVGKDGDETGDQVILSGFDQGNFTFNSFFRAAVINDPVNPTNQVNHPLMQGSKAQDNNGGDNTINFYLNTLYKPTLNLQVIHTLKDDSDNTIPYLEYQFKAPINLSSDLPVSNTSKVVRVDVMVDGGYSETLEKTIALPKPISGFVISQ